MRGRWAGLLLAATAVMLVAPAMASAGNGYGLTYVGQSRCLECHGGTTGRWEVGTFLTTKHARTVTNIAQNPTALEPLSGSTVWPSPLFGAATLRFGPSDIMYQIGSPGMGHRYISLHRNDVAVKLSTETTMTTVSGPADDYRYFHLKYETEDRAWASTANSPRLFFQSCGGCHFTGVTRPLQTDYTLGNGNAAGRSTETSFAAPGITCETCHATGQTSESHRLTGVKTVPAIDALSSDTCGQCHVRGVAKERNYSNGSLNSPNGYTADRPLSDFFSTIYGTKYLRSSAASPWPTIPADDPDFYPTGHAKEHGHSGTIYNEWMISGHGQSLRSRATGQLFIPYLQDECLPCHSTEGFLQSIDYDPMYTNSVGMHESSVANDRHSIGCSACHTVHSRTGEALGLRLPEEELCASCHTAGITEGGSANAGDEIHNPVKEMRAGYGLIGVPRPAKPWMEEATCPSCHMPSGSHRMRPMTPGDAEEWDVEEGGDSCSPCHGFKSLAQLQADLDGWRQDLHSVLDEATQTVAAAQARPAATTAQGVALLAAANTNIEFIEADPSDGAHNFPYALAGAEKARDLARAVGSTFTRFGATAYDPSTSMALCYGTLRYGDGTPAAGQRVQIQARAGGNSAWVTLGTTTTGDDGDFAYGVSPSVTTAYRAVWTPVGSSSAFVSATHSIARSSTTALRVSASRARLGSTLVLSGSVAPNKAGSRVTIRYRRGTGAWRTIGARTLSTSSGYSLTFRPGTRGTYSFKATFAGDASNTGSTSAVRTTRVY